MVWRQNSNFFWPYKMNIMTQVTLKWPAFLSPAGLPAVLENLEMFLEKKIVPDFWNFQDVLEMFLNFEKIKILMNI